MFLFCDFVKMRFSFIPNQCVIVIGVVLLERMQCVLLERVIMIIGFFKDIDCSGDFEIQI